VCERIRERENKKSVCVGEYIHECVYIDTNIYTCIYIKKVVSVCVYIYMYTCKLIFIYNYICIDQSHRVDPRFQTTMGPPRLCVCVCVCVCVCLEESGHIHTNIFICTFVYYYTYIDQSHSVDPRLQTAKGPLRWCESDRYRDKERDM